MAKDHGYKVVPHTICWTQCSVEGLKHTKKHMFHVLLRPKMTASTKITYLSAAIDIEKWEE